METHRKALPAAQTPHAAGRAYFDIPATSIRFGQRLELLIEGPFSLAEGVVTLPRIRFARPRGDA